MFLLGEGVFLTSKNQSKHITSKMNFSFQEEEVHQCIREPGINSVFFTGLRTRAGVHAHSNSLQKLNILKIDA